MAHGALIAHTCDVGLVCLVAAQWTIAVDAEVADDWCLSIRNRSVDGCKAVTRVDDASSLDAVAAVIPIWAVQALMAHTIDLLVTPIADSIVAYITARGEQGLGGEGQDGLLGRWLEAVGRMMAMLVTSVASDAQIKVIA